MNARNSLMLLLLGVMVFAALAVLWRSSSTAPPPSNVPAHESLRQVPDAQLAGQVRDAPSAAEPVQVEGQSAPDSRAGRSGPGNTSALVGLTEPANGELPQAVVGLKDEGVLFFYKQQLLELAKLEERVRAGQMLSRSAKDSMAVSLAVKTCIEQQRFWYLGPKSTLPQYSHLQSATNRYIATAVGDTAMVFELTIGEYPGAFENDPRAIRK